MNILTNGITYIEENNNIQNMVITRWCCYYIDLRVTMNNISGHHISGNFYINDNIASNLLLNSNSLLYITDNAQIDNLLISGGAYIVTIQPEKNEQRYILSSVIDQTDYTKNTDYLITSSIVLQQAIPSSITGIDIPSNKQFSISNGIASSLIINNKSIVYANSGAQIISANINSGGHAFIYVGAKISGTTINQNGILTVQIGGSANDIIINNGGKLLYHSNATIKDITLNDGGITGFII